MLIIPKDSESSAGLSDLLQASSASFRKIRLYDRDVILADHSADIDPGYLGITISEGLASRKFKPASTRVHVRDLNIGPDRLVIAAGPCAVESGEQISAIAAELKKSGADILRGGAFKPRTSPYSFQGLGIQGLKLLKDASDETGLPVVSEILDPSQFPYFQDSVDILQIGSRNSQNFSLLKFAGTVHMPVLLKNGMGNSINEWLGSAEYILSGGNPDVIMCYRGIRSFEGVTRFTMDSGAIVALGRMTHLPVCADPSHPAGRRELVEPLALAAVAAGATMLEVEVHNDPDRALSDAEQQITFEQFRSLNRNAHDLFQLLHSSAATVF
ncbi:MAG: 3-deoxy-7-phosphoheptulonate synthase [Thermoplasmataceae archaeon]